MKNSRNPGFSYYFCLMIEGSRIDPEPYLAQRIRIREAQTHPDPQQFADPHPLVWRLCCVQYSWIDRLGPPQKVKGDILRRLNIRPSQARNLPIFLHARYAACHTSPQCCGTLTIFYGSGSGSDFWKVMVPVPVPTFEKLWFRFRLLLFKKLRFRFQLHI